MMRGSTPSTALQHKRRQQGAQCLPLDARLRTQQRSCKQAHPKMRLAGSYPAGLELLSRLGAPLA